MREDKNENRWDKLLQIHTMGRDDSRSDLYRYPYEPTPYCVLERMANTGMIRKENTLLDYGCGKGRVDFFLSAQTRCQSIGVDLCEGNGKQKGGGLWRADGVCAGERRKFSRSCGSGPGVFF